MRVRRRTRADQLEQQRAAAEAQAALSIVAQHADAGRRAQTTAHAAWSPPQMWSQGVAAPASAPSPPPAASAAVVDVPVELLRVLEAVMTMCDHVIEYIEADRAERPLMIEALTKLARALPAAPPLEANGNGDMHAERLIGGSVDAGPEPVIDLRTPETAVEVRCRFGDRWVDGFEICEVHRDEPGVRYRLRRRIDSVVLPDLFDAADIRHIETFEELTSSAPPTIRHWSPI